MEYEITQVIRYLVTAETPSEAIDIFNSHPRTGVVEWQDDNIQLFDEEIEVNGQMNADAIGVLSLLAIMLSLILFMNRGDK